MNTDSEADTFNSRSSPPAGLLVPSPSSLVRVDVAALSDQGKVRSNNEDHYWVTCFGRSLETLMTNLPEGLVPGRIEEIGYVMLVADGMGGMAAGEVASRLAISTLVDLVLSTPDWIMRIGEPEVEEVMRRIAERFSRVNAVLIEQATRDPRLAGMGTTMTLAFSLGADLFIAHVGDSRLYLLRQGALHKLTRDHTMAQQLMDAGLGPPQGVGVERFQHILTQALGAEKVPFKPQVQHLLLADGDQLLLCTDGLTDMVNDAAIAAVLQEKLSATEACQALVDLALHHGGRDNVTVAVGRYSIPPLP